MFPFRYGRRNSIDSTHHHHAVTGGGLSGEPSHYSHVLHVDVVLDRGRDQLRGCLDSFSKVSVRQALGLLVPVG